MRYLYSIGILWLSLFSIISCEDFTPRITKTKGSQMSWFEIFDDSTTLLKLENYKIFISKDNGEQWNTIKDIPDDVSSFTIDPFYPKDRAFVMLKGSNSYYRTDNQGKSWERFNYNIPNDLQDSENMEFCRISSHPTERKELLLSCNVCMNVKKEKHDEKEKDKDKGGLLDDILDGLNDLFSSSRRVCQLISFRSDNNGKSFVLIDAPYKIDEKQKDNLFHSGTSCEYAKLSKDSTVEVDEVTVICSFQQVERVRNSQFPFKSKSQLFTVKGNNIEKLDFFKDMTVTTMQVLNSYLVVITQEDKFNDYSNKKIWVSTDMKTFKEAYIPTQLNFNEVSLYLFEDSLGRIVIPVEKVDITETKHSKADSDRGMPQSSRNFQYSEILVSDSTGLKFSSYDWVDKDADGITTFEPVNFLKGTLISNFYPRNRAKREKSLISFDNGETWENLKVVDPENKGKYRCDIDDPETCSIISLDNYINGGAPSPGILVFSGVLSDGYDNNFDDKRTFISRDGGKTWRKTLDFPTLSVVGDGGNVIVAVPYWANSDDDPESEIYYSLDQGKTWKEYQLDEPIFPARLINTTPDGSGTNFILDGFFAREMSDEEKEFPNFLYTIDFSDAFDGKICGEDDFETFYLNDKEPVNGAIYSYRRRKQDSKCLVREVFTDLELKEEICEQCTDADYECAFEFSKNSEGKCIPDSQLLAFSGICSGNTNQKKELSLNTKQKIKNNKCKKELEVEKTKVSCDLLPEPIKNSDKITVTETSLDGQIRFYQYFDTNEDESLIIGTSRYELYISHDGGKTLKKIDVNGERIIEIVYNPHSNSSAYLFSADGSIFITHDRGYTFSSHDLPDAIQLGFPLNFHESDPDSFIYYGGKGCDSIFNPKCTVVSYITRDGGRTFEELLENAVHCEFSGSLYEYPFNKDMITCQVKDTAKSTKSLISSTDYFKNERKVIFDNIIGFMTSGGYSIVAVGHGNKELRAYVTIDGEEYAEVKLPQDLTEIKQQTFTVLGTNVGSIFLHMGTNLERGDTYGDILKSNSNGTSFVTLQKNVNSNSRGQVDFEKIQGLEGIILINTVENPEILKSTDEEKRLKTKITFNDGSDWSYLSPPTVNSEGKKYNCESKSLDKCSLNLHGYSERRDFRDSYSSGSAHGMMFAVGSVGEYLLPFEECSTFLTVDGGNTWKEVKKGVYQWEFGDHGGILVLVPDKENTDSLSYSLDFGKTWNDYKFTEQKVVVRDIVTVPQDSALRFLLIGQSTNIQGGATDVYSIDFSGSFDRQCNFEINNNKNDDFAFASVIPSQDECLFGHQEEYLKKINNNCFVGNIPLSQFSRIVKNCTCTRKDFECDYNFQKANDGTCKLVEGLSPAPASDICRKNPELIEFSEQTGYRKIPLSTCKGGLKLDTSSDFYPCPGKEVEFNEKHGIKGRSFLLIFFVPFIAFSVCLWFVYDRGIRRNGGFARFGEIRLGEENQFIENNETDRIVNATVRGGLVFFSGVYGVFQRTKGSFKGLFQRLNGRFSTRGGPSYSSLMNDQFLDEADDLLAGHDEDANDLSSFMDHESNFDIDEDSNAAPDNTDDSSNVPHELYTDDVASDDVPAPLNNTLPEEESNINQEE